MSTHITTMSGSITIFTRDSCLQCIRVKELLFEEGMNNVQEISLTKHPEWKPLLFLLTKGSYTLPQVFFNDSHIGGLTELEKLSSSGKLTEKKTNCSTPNTPSFPELRTPNPTEYFQLVPSALRENWQTYIDGLNEHLGGERQIELVMMMMDTPVHKMVVVCSAGVARSKFKVGAAGADKGSDGTEEKLYCQIVMQERKTIFFNDPADFPPGLKNNEDHVKYGYSYYIGAPWVVGDMRGTIVALEKEAGILKDEHVPIIESVRNKIEKEWKEYLYLEY